MFLKNEEDPTTKIIDDDESIRSLPEAQDITADIPEDRMDPKKVRPLQMAEFLRKYVSRRLLALSEGKIAVLTTAMRQLGIWLPGRCRSPRHFPPGHLR